jgi:hypothetical protein
MSQIKWSPTTRALGRNGTLKCGGLDVWHGLTEPVVTLRPLTSKGFEARCSIQIPKEKVERVIQALAPKGQRACCFIEVSDLVPKSWLSWFWTLISEKAPFNWGDNNRTLVTADAFADHCEARLLDCDETSQAAKTKFLNKLRDLGETYLDLEN